MVIMNEAEPSVFLMLILLVISEEDSFSQSSVHPLMSMTKKQAVARWQCHWK